MPRSLALVFGVVGLVAAAYLAFHRSTPALGVTDRQIDGPLFAIAIAVVSVLLLASARRSDDRAASSQSFDAM
jgi:hypothetical protein